MFGSIDGMALGWAWILSFLSEARPIIYSFWRESRVGIDLIRVQMVRIYFDNLKKKLVTKIVKGRLCEDCVM